MCCCGKPTINGEPGAYSWDGKSFMTYQPVPPKLADDDQLIADEPGRCGGIDSHCLHFCLVKRHGQYALLVRHGGGEERIELGSRPGITTIASLDSNGRYWLLQMLYHAQEKAGREARDKANQTWRKAAAEKRIKTRKYPGRGVVKVWIEQTPVAPVVVES